MQLVSLLSEIQWLQEYVLVKMDGMMQELQYVVIYTKDCRNKIIFLFFVILKLPVIIVVKLVMEVLKPVVSLVMEPLLLELLTMLKTSAIALLAIMTMVRTRHVQNVTKAV
jgi:hypothetical protein